VSKIIIPHSVHATCAEIEIMASRLDAWYFVSNFCYTEDPHDHLSPTKKLPDKDYLRIVTEYWSAMKEDLRWMYPVLLIPKSRQMLITWLMLGLHLWLAISRNSQRIYIQAQKQEDANELLERFMFIYYHLEPCFKEKVKVVKSLTEKTYFSNRSQVLALAKGGSQIRQKTASAILSDEGAFQEDMDEAYRAAKPTIVGGGRMTIVSSAEEGFMKEMVMDTMKVVEKYVA
jgi:hypothetical protein